MIAKDLFVERPVWMFWFYTMDISVRIWGWELTSPFGSRINTFLFDQLYS